MKLLLRNTGTHVHDSDPAEPQSALCRTESFLSAFPRVRTTYASISGVPLQGFHNSRMTRGRLASTDRKVEHLVYVSQRSPRKWKPYKHTTGRVLRGKGLSRLEGIT